MSSTATIARLLTSKGGSKAQSRVESMVRQAARRLPWRAHSLNETTNFHSTILILTDDDDLDLPSSAEKKESCISDTPPCPNGLLSSANGNKKCEPHGEIHKHPSLIPRSAKTGEINRKTQIRKRTTKQKKRNPTSSHISNLMEGRVRTRMLSLQKHPSSL